VTAAEWTPTHNRQHPPFEPGNELSARHGAYSPRKVDPLAAELVALVDEDQSVSWLSPVDRPALYAWARATVQAQLLTEWLEKAAEETQDGVGDLDSASVRAVYLLLHRAETRARSERSRLGFDPLSRAKLHRDKAATGVDVARVMAEMDRREKEQAAKRAAGEVIEGGDAS
jgi:hypothetical protein